MLSHHCQQVWGFLWTPPRQNSPSARCVDPRDACETEHRSSVGARGVLFTSSGRAEVTEAQLLRCSCRFTWGQSELSFIIIEPRRQQAQGWAHLATPMPPPSDQLQERQTTLDKPHYSLATRGSSSVRSGLWWQTAMGQLAVQVFDGFNPISSFQTVNPQVSVRNTYICRLPRRPVQQR